MAARASPQSFAFAAGEAFRLRFDCGVDLTGMTLRFAMKRKASDAAAALSTVDGSAVTSLAGTEAFDVEVSDENTEDLRGTYRYSAEVEDLAGDKSEVAYGFLTFQPSAS